MSKGGISQTQRMALLWCGLLAPAAELFPNLLLPAAGRGAWLALAAAGPLVLAAAPSTSHLAKAKRSIKVTLLPKMKS